jgi:CheY-like chemotaxis protein
MQRLVLIVDDSDQLTATLEVALSALPNIGVVSASNGVEALSVLKGRTDVCAMVTDLRMPRMDGFELIGRIRTDGRLSRLPIIAVSGDSDPHTPDRARKLGADAFFSKPFSPAGLREELARLIDSQ